MKDDRFNQISGGCGMQGVIFKSGQIHCRADEHLIKYLAASCIETAHLQRQPRGLGE